MDLIDIIEAQRRRDEAIARVDAHAPAEWKEEAYLAGCGLAASRTPFIADEIWFALHDAGVGESRYLEPRALGAVVRRLQREGRIRPTGRYVCSSRPVCHRNPKREWIGV